MLRVFGVFGLVASADGSTDAGADLLCSFRSERRALFVPSSFAPARFAFVSGLRGVVREPAFFAAAFESAAFFAEGFFAGFAGAFFAGAFLTGAFFAARFLTAAFFPATFFAGDFFAGDFFTAGFFGADFFADLGADFLASRAAVARFVDFGLTFAAAGALRDFAALFGFVAFFAGFFAADFDAGRAPDDFFAGFTFLALPFLPVLPGFFPFTTAI
ncbi:MAG: hypothetical protein WBX15_07590 [Thermoanaerobaculia bacterium]